MTTPEDTHSNGILSAELEDGAYNSFQYSVYQWGVSTFGKECVHQIDERVWRFLEEALELAQALNITEADVMKLVDYTYNRPPGDPKQEVGGVMTTLSILCSVCDIDFMSEGHRELARINTPDVISRVRQKNKNKTPNSPLPGPTD